MRLILGSGSQHGFISTDSYVREVVSEVNPVRSLPSYCQSFDDAFMNRSIISMAAISCPLSWSRKVASYQKYSVFGVSPTAITLMVLRYSTSAEECQRRHVVYRAAGENRA